MGKAKKTPILYYIHTAITLLIMFGFGRLLAIIQPLSTLIVSEESGITGLLMGILEPIFGGRSPIFFIVIIGLIATLVTNMMNNGAIGVALMPIIYTYCTTAGIHPQLAVILVVICVHFAFLTPAASAAAAMLHGNEWLDLRSIWKAVPIVLLISWIAVTTVVLTLGRVLFPLYL